MKPRNRWTRVLASALAATMMLTALAGCGDGSSSGTSQSGSSGSSGSSASSGEGSVKDEVVVILRAEPSNIDPHGNTELVAMTTQVQIFETLVTKDQDGNIIPCLAESWEQIDERTTRFTLRDDVYFHNGEKLTAEDVVFTIQRAVEKPSSAAIFAAFDPENTKVVDERTVDVATTEPFAAVFNYLASTRGGIVCKKAVEEMGDDAFGRSPVGTGPFVFDFAKMDFRRDGGPVELSKTEQRLLRALVENRGHAVTRAQLVDWVWTDGAEFVEENALSVTVKRLRSKLEADPSRPEYLKTVYGIGYTWAVQP